MIKIYDYTHVLKGTYFFREGSTVVLADMDKRTVQASSAGLRLQLLLSRYMVNEIKKDSDKYNYLMEQYKSILAALVLPNRYEFRVLTPASCAEMEKEAEELNEKLLAEGQDVEEEEAQPVEYI